MAPQASSTPPDTGIKEQRPYAPRMPADQRREQLLDAALGVILRQGYGGVSIQAVARAAGATRPVIHDHFANLGRLLQAPVEREKRSRLVSLSRCRPRIREAETPSSSWPAVPRSGRHPAGDLRLILLPLEGTPAVVRQHVEINRAWMLARLEAPVGWALERPELPSDLDVELTAPAIRDLGEAADRMLLTDPKRYTPERYESFVESVMKLVRGAIAG